MASAGELSTLTIAQPYQGAVVLVFISHLANFGDDQIAHGCDHLVGHAHPKVQAVTDLAFAMLY
jgi:hypothetical protein